MATILSIESSGDICSVALHKNGLLLDCIESKEPNIHGQKLAVFIQEITKNQRVEISSLHAIAVSEGPGSYTGLRIGTSVAKGLCYAQKLPFIAIDTLQALAWGIMNQYANIVSEASILMPMIDARRMEVYTACFDTQLTKIKKTAPLILDETFYASILQPTILAGNGSLKIQASVADSQITLLPDISLSAKHLGWLAYEKYQKNAFENVAYFEPVYLKEFAKIIAP